MDNFIYMHHSGQFYHKNHIAKIQTALGHKLYVNVNHDITYSLEISTNDTWKKCTNQNNQILDSCIINALDAFYLKSHGCVLPFQTFRPNEKQCILNSTMKFQYWEYLQTTVFQKECIMPCASMDVTFPPFAYDTGSNNEAYAKLYLLSIVKVQTSYLSYPIISLLAEVGGYMGLLLGMSLMDINKVLHWIYNIYKERLQ